MLYIIAFPGFSCQPLFVGILHWPFFQNIIVTGLAACIADLYASPLSSKLEEFHPVGALI